MLTVLPKVNRVHQNAELFSTLKALVKPHKDKPSDILTPNYDTDFISISGVYGKQDFVYEDFNKYYQGFLKQYWIKEELQLVRAILDFKNLKVTLFFKVK